MTGITSAAGSFAYGYPASPSALIQSLALPNAAGISYQYDSLARLTNSSLANYWGHVLDGYGYALDALGQRTNISRYLGITTNNISAGYDNIGQLISWSAKESAGTARLNEQLGYGFDAAGNLQNRTNVALVQSFAVDALNQLSTVSRNANFTETGATPAPATNITVNGGAAQTYGDFTFARTNITLANGNNGFTNIAQNVYGVTVTNTFTLNLPSSVTLLYDGNGNLTDRFQYSAYGMLIARGGTNDTPFQYNGRYGVQTDSNGLLYMRARYYNPYICRFINADPSGFTGGLNFYVYASGNPISKSDPLGLYPGAGSPGYGNPISGPNGPVGPSDPYASGEPYYPNGMLYTPVTYPLLPFPAMSGGVIFNGAAETGLTYGAGANYSSGGGLFYQPGDGPSIGGFQSFGAFAGGVLAQTTAQFPSGGSQSDFVIGDTEGVSAGVWLSNAGQPSDLGGPFTAYNLNLMDFNASVSYANGIGIISITLGTPAGESVSGYPTTTFTAGGFNLFTGKQDSYSSNK